MSNKAAVLWEEPFPGAVKKVILQSYVKVKLPTGNQSHEKDRSKR